MTELLGALWWMIVSLGILVTIHEFGHYWVARRCGVHVLRFSVGFGKPLWIHRNAAGTEFALAAIPLGGYVKMLDAREFDIPADQHALAFNNKSVWQRIAITAAGPLANLLLCIALLWVMFLIGRQDYSATLAPPTGLAAEAGLRAGQRITHVDDRAVSTWTDATLALTLQAMDRHDTTLRTLDAQGAVHDHQLRLSQLPVDFDERNVPALTGIQWAFLHMPPIVAHTLPGGPADGRLQPGDHIVQIDGQPVSDAVQVIPLIQQLGQREDGGNIDVLRNGHPLSIHITPQPSHDTDKPQWLLGVQFASPSLPEADASQRYGVLAAIPAALRETSRLTSDTFGMLRRLVTGHASLQNISGPVTIARVANASAKNGIDRFLYYLALMSLSLCILNLLPIPILDGGHLLYYLIELIKGSPLSEQSMALGQSIGLALLAGLMGLAFYNDILSLF